MTWRRAAIGLAVAALLVLAFTVAGPRAAGSATGPGGTLALRQLYAARGLDVRDGDRPPRPGGAFLLTVDLRDSRQADELLDWAAEGGRLIVADPASAVVSALGVVPARRIGGITGTEELEPGCVSAPAVAAPRIEVAAADAALESGQGLGAECYGSFVVHVPHGAGDVVLLGGTSPLTNELLASADNARFALALTGEAREVVFGAPLPPGGAGAGGGAWSLLPAPARVVILALVAAAVVFAMSRARRLGRPLPEEPLSPIPSGELVGATGRLYRSARATAHAGAVLRAATRADLERRLGLAPGASSAAIGAAARSPSATAVLDGPEPRTDAELMALAARLDLIRDDIERGSR